MSDQAKLLLFQDLFARERDYLTLEPHFPYRNGRHKAAPALEEYTNRPPPKPGECCALKPNSFSTCSTNPSLPKAIDPDDRLALCLCSVLLESQIAKENKFKARIEKIAASNSA